MAHTVSLDCPLHRALLESFGLDPGLVLALAKYWHITPPLLASVRIAYTVAAAAAAAASLPSILQHIT